MIIFITNSIIPYCYDVANILGLPERHSYRFRYRRRWVEASVDLDISAYRHDEALIVLRNFETGNFIPIRFSRIEEVFTVGDINYIEFQLLDCVSETDIEYISSKICQILINKGLKNIPNQQLNYLVFQVDNWQIGNFQSIEQRDSLQRWSNLVAKVGQIGCYKNFGFLKILHLRESNGTKAIIKKDGMGKFLFHQFQPLIQHCMEI